MDDKLQNEWRRRIIFILMVIMMASVFFSRVLLSVSMMVFILVSFLHTDFKSQVKNYFNTPLLLGISLLFFLPTISGLWNQHGQDWMDTIRIKLPMVFLPAAFASPFGFSKKDWERLVILFIVFVTAGTIWTMVFYISDLHAVQENYLRSQIMMTPMESYHVGFSWMICIAILLTGWLWLEKKGKMKKASWVLLITIVWLIIFLHILAARTGLFSFYLAIFFISIWLVFKKLKLLYGGILLLVFISLPVISYLVLPTFHNRVKYFLYDLPYFSKAHYKPGMNDAVRIISLKAGWNVMNEHPVKGVGFGDILVETKKWYGENYPEMIEVDKIYPSSEWLMYGTGCGWPGFFIFSLVMLVPFTVKRIKEKWLWYLVNAIAAFIFLFDIGLEVQFGVFIYCFILLWMWKWLRQ